MSDQENTVDTATAEAQEAEAVAVEASAAVAADADDWTGISAALRHCANQFRVYCVQQ